MVSIRCLVYNHEPFLRQCLDGFVMQQVNFSYEAIVHDDASTDGSAEIIKEYAEKYPDIIKPILETENQYSKRDGSLRRIMNAHTRGKYVALCEGDDYWTDPLKLQKQVDFLESHPDYSMCFHRCNILLSDGTMTDKGFDFLEKREYSFEEIALTWSIPTASVLYRSDLLPRIPQNKKFTIGDNVVFFTCACYGRIFCMGDVLSVYRKHDGGWTAHAPMQGLVENLQTHTRALIESFPKKMHGVFRKMLARNYVYLLRMVYRTRPFYSFSLVLSALFECPVEFFMEIRQTTKNPFIKKLFIEKQGNRIK